MKFTSKTYLALGAAVLGTALLTPRADAVQLTGDVTINGDVRYNTTNLATATQAVAFGLTSTSGVLAGSPMVVSSSGNFVLLAPVLTPALFGTNINLNSGASQLLYTLPSGLTFTLTSSTIAGQSASFLNVNGTGTITAPGFDATPGVFSLASTSAGGAQQATFGFTSNTAARPAGVPDGGSALALLGLAVLGVEVVRRKVGSLV